MPDVAYLIDFVWNVGNIGWISRLPRVVRISEFDQNSVLGWSVSAPVRIVARVWEHIGVV